MRHRKKLNHLGRTNSHRKAMLANMASSLILHKRISTTTAKAKALRIYLEPLMTKAKSDSTHSRRLVFSYLKNKHAVSELFREVATKIADRPGGYTRILKTGNRLGDNADMCIIELVDYNENMLTPSTDTKTRAKRTRRRGGKKKEAEAVPKAVAEGADEKLAAQADIAEDDKKEAGKEEEIKEETPDPESAEKKDQKAEPAPESVEKKDQETEPSPESVEKKDQETEPAPEKTEAEEKKAPPKETKKKQAAKDKPETEKEAGKPAEDQKKPDEKGDKNIEGKKE